MTPLLHTKAQAAEEGDAIHQGHGPAVGRSLSRESAEHARKKGWASRDGSYAERCKAPLHGERQTSCGTVGPKVHGRFTGATCTGTNNSPDGYMTDDEADELAGYAMVRCEEIEAALQAEGYDRATAEAVAWLEFCAYRADCRADGCVGEERAILQALASDRRAMANGLKNGEHVGAATSARR